MITVEESYRHCVRISRARARNFYYSFLLLPREKRLAMCAIYAFMRQCDDLSDEDSDGGVAAKRAALEQWRLELDSGVGSHPLWPAFHDTVARYHIPPRYFHEMLDGVSSDLEAQRMATFEELYRYCYHVASVVGLTITHIFGFEEPKALALAEQCGVAFQLTNIVRDVKEDAALGRVYLPEDELRANHVTSIERPSPELTRLLESLGERAHAYYRASRPLLDLVHPDSRTALWALMEIYHRLLVKIERGGYDVFTKRVRLSAFEKSAIVARAWFSTPG